MMINSTQVLFFTLTAYFHSEVLNYVYFTVVLCLYVLIVGSNVLLIVVICVNRSLHEPMYMFLCSLFVNELYGSTGLFPLLMVQILSDVHMVAAPLCFLQIYCVYTYAHIEFCNLAVMSYDRYLAICHPLQYHSLMTPSKITKLVALTWLFPLLESVAGMFLTVTLQLCGNIIDKTRQKAVSTCTPHLASLINFSFGCFFDIFQSRFDMSRVPDALRVILSLYFLTCQPLFNPLLYGLNISKIRSFSKKLFFGKR
uniref:Olfactory receptor 4E2-like n=1 Tax=Fundulus heteroclitus TaxID=8078 RepID=A0A3Q2Q1H3_FUNHE